MHNLFKFLLLIILLPNILFSEDFGDIPSNLTLGASESVRRNAGDTAFEAYVTPSGTNTGDVTLAGTPDYITISGQVITRNQIDLTADVTGILPVANGGTGLNNATIAFGNYTPTLVNSTNVASSTAFVWQYIRVGNVVTVSGQVNVDTTATGTAQIFASIPIASNFATATELAGVGTNALGDSMRLLADATNDRVQIDFTASSALNQACTISFTYSII